MAALCIFFERLKNHPRGVPHICPPYIIHTSPGEWADGPPPATVSLTPITPCTSAWPSAGTQRLSVYHDLPQITAASLKSTATIHRHSLQSSAAAYHMDPGLEASIAWHMWAYNTYKQYKMRSGVSSDIFGFNWN